MKLIGLLNWYDEPAWCLVECVNSLVAAGVDHLVAVDGAYMLYPNGRAQSASDQAQAIMAAAHGAGIGLTLHAPQEQWVGNEVEKRSFLFAAGHLVAEAHEDWFWVTDADEVVTEALGVRERLEQTKHDAGEVLIEMTSERGQEGLLPVRKLFRAQPAGIWLEHNHFRYVTNDGRLLWNGYMPPCPELVDAETMHMVRVLHRGEITRSPARLSDRERYYDRREATGAELVPA